MRRRVEWREKKTHTRTLTLPLSAYQHINSLTVQVHTMKMLLTSQSETFMLIVCAKIFRLIIYFGSLKIYISNCKQKKHSKRISAKQRKKYNAQFFFSYLLIITRINERIYKYQHWIDKSQCKFELNYKHFCSLEWMTIEFLLA